MGRELVVIGGGVSGLAVATELARQGHVVTVLEAKDRFGGRIHTLRGGTVPVELGAEFVHGSNKSLMKLIHASGVSLHEVSDRNRVFADGRLQEFNVWDKFNDLIHQMDSKQPDVAFNEFLETRKLPELDRQMMLAFVQGFNAAAPDLISAQALLKAEEASEEMEGDKQARINGGYSILTDFMIKEARAHGVKLCNNAEVRRVNWRHGFVKVELASGESIAADAAVITLPLGVLKGGNVIFDPPLVQKREAISQMLFGNVVRISFLFDERWWEQELGFVHKPDENFPTWWSDTTGPVLTAWAGGPKADELRALAPAELEQAALNGLQTILGISNLRSRLISSHTYDWANDPHVGGAYSYVPVGGSELPKILAEPIEETLFFAGEATAEDLQMGTVFGALESGLRAARLAGRI